jgi:hypothetical protein
MKKKYISPVFAIVAGLSLFALCIFVLPTSTMAQSDVPGVTGDNPIGGATTIPGGGSFGQDPGLGLGNPAPTPPPADQTTPPPTVAYTGYCVQIPSAPFKDLPEIIKYVTCLLDRSVVPLLFGIALVVFLWGAVKFIQASESSEKEEGRQFMLWGVIALTVMVSVWGLVSIFGTTFGIKTVIPQLPVNSQSK